MSIVVAVQKHNKIVVASDSMSVFGHHREDQTNIVNNEKIIACGSALLAFTGWGLYGNIFHHYLGARKTAPRLGNDRQIFDFFLRFLRELRDKYSLVNEHPQQEKDPFADLDSSFLVANRNGIYGVSSNLSVSHYRRFHAIGSGCDYAFGALHTLYETKLTAEEIARKAVESAIYFDADCGGAIVVKRPK